MNTSGLERTVRNALVRAERAGRTIGRGACGTYKQCGPVTPNGHACVVCAFLVTKEVGMDEADLEGRMAEILDVPLGFVVSLIGGFDGDELDEGGDRSAWLAGRRLAKEFL